MPIGVVLVGLFVAFICCVLRRQKHETAQSEPKNSTPGEPAESGLSIDDSADSLETENCVPKPSTRVAKVV